MIDIDDRLEHARQLLGAIPGAAERAIARALNRAIVTARATSITDITERYAVKAGDLRDRLTTRNARPADLEASLTARSGSLPLHYFPHAPTAPGTGGPGKPTLTATVLSGSTKPVPGAFVAHLGTKDRIVRRTGSPTRTGKQGLKVLYTVPIGSMLGNEAVRTDVEGAALETFDKRLEHEIDRGLQAAAGAA